MTLILKPKQTRFQAPFLITYSSIEVARQAKSISKLGTVNFPPVTPGTPCRPHQTKKTHPYLGLDSGFCKFSVRMTTTAGVIGAAPIGDSATPGIPNRRDQTSPLGGWARSRRGSLRLRLREIYPFRLKCRTVPPPRPRETGLSLQK
jgi:hypothetical protein